MPECMTTEIGCSGSLPSAVSFLRSRFQSCHIIEFIQEFLGAQAEEILLFFCKRIYHIIIRQCNIIHKACV